jgi:hypothetical protein
MCIKQAEMCVLHGSSMSEPNERLIAEWYTVLNGGDEETWRSCHRTSSFVYRQDEQSRASSLPYSPPLDPDRYLSQARPKVPPLKRFKSAMLQSPRPRAASQLRSAPEHPR